MRETEHLRSSWVLSRRARAVVDETGPGRLAARGADRSRGAPIGAKPSPDPAAASSPTLNLEGSA